MATALQIAANRRNAKKSTGPRTAEGKKRASLNHLKHGMTAKTVILPHESANDYDEIREALIKDYAPATSQELMLVDQIAAGYWRTIRARKFEVAIFDNQLRTKKHEHGKSTKPNERDDEGCAVILQVTDPNDLKNYFRYDATISRDYYRAIATLEKMQAARRREEDRQANRTATIRERTNSPIIPDNAGSRQGVQANRTATIRERTNSPVIPDNAGSRQGVASTPFNTTGFVSHNSAHSGNSRDPEPPLHEAVQPKHRQIV